MKVGTRLLVLLVMSVSPALLGQDAEKGAPVGAQEARPNPDASGVYQAGPGVSAPKLIYQTEPEYSNLARRKKISGSCVVGLTVDAAGEPQNVHVVKSLADGMKPKMRAAALSLDEQAVLAVRQYRFQPAMFQGQLVPAALNVEVNFKIF